MKEKITYICEICGGTYATEEIALKCENFGNPKHYNEFVGKWIILPIQVLTDIDTENSSSLTSSVEFYPVRVDRNEIVGPMSYDFLSQLKVVQIVHSLKLSTSSFITHNIIKQYLDLALVIPESYTEILNNFLVQSEQARLANTTNWYVLQEVKRIVEEIAKNSNYSLNKPEGVAKYEYNSK